MLSYQHDYHAGSHADVLKHSVLALLIEALKRKPAALRVIDSHAGSGGYDLEGALAQRGREFATGVSCVLEAPDPPAPLGPYLGALNSLNTPGALRYYPGSPQLALSLLRPHDHLELFELHPQALEALQTRFGRERQVHMHRRDGFEGLVAVVPPQERRGLALIDPSYERKDEFARVARCVAEAFKRWRNGVYVIWYPLIRHAGPELLVKQLSKLSLPRLFRVELEVVARDAPGLRGSGLAIANLPYEVDAALLELLPWLHRRLAVDGAGAWRAHWLSES
jgi:23S rRNA (adenine2030-N6)-methyltransferase